MEESNSQESTIGMSSRSSSGSPFHFAELLFVGIAFVFLAVRLFRLISEYSVNIFFVDQWDFNDATLFQHHSIWQMFAWQHGPPRLGLGNLFERLVDPIFRWNSRTESFVVGIVLVIATICALWLKNRLFGRLSYSDAIIPLLLLSFLEYQTLFVVADFAHGPIPVILILLYCVAWTTRNVFRRYALVLGINFLTIYTGFGLLLGVLTPVLVIFDYWANLRRAQNGRRYLVAGLLLSTASFATFFTGYKSQPAADCFTYQIHSVGSYIRFSVLMFAPFFGAQGTDALPTLTGTLLVFGLFIASASSGWALLRGRGAQWTRHAAIASLTAFCLLFCMATAYGRLCMGLLYAQESRYVVYLNLGLLGLYFSLLTISDKVVRNMLVIVFGVALLGSIFSGERSRTQMAYWHNTKEKWRDCYLAGGSIEECNKVSWIYPGAPETTHLKEKLDFLRSTRQNLFADSK
jgi:hypothetical protein